MLRQHRLFLRRARDFFRSLPSSASPSKQRTLYRRRRTPGHNNSFFLYSFCLFLGLGSCFNLASSSSKIQCVIAEGIVREYKIVLTQWSANRECRLIKINANSLTGRFFLFFHVLFRPVLWQRRLVASSVHIVSCVSPSPSVSQFNYTRQSLSEIHRTFRTVPAHPGYTSTLCSVDRIKFQRCCAGKMKQTKKQLEKN